MSRPDFVQEVLDYLDGNWQTGNFDPQPALVDGDEMRLYSGGRARSLDVLNQNIITADSGPTVTNTAIGTEYDFDVRAGVGIQIEGYHADDGGQVSDKDEFNSLVSEARRAILSERTYPVGSYHTLKIEQENDDSPAASHNDANYFRYLFDVWFEGYESLP
jgi:hypothetical protein